MGLEREGESEVRDSGVRKGRESGERVRVGVKMRGEWGKRENDREGVGEWGERE